MSENTDNNKTTESSVSNTILSPQAQDLLKTAIQLHPSGIPVEWLKHFSGLTPEVCQAAVSELQQKGILVQSLEFPELYELSSSDDTGCIAMAGSDMSQDKKNLFRICVQDYIESDLLERDIDYWAGSDLRWQLYAIYLFYSMDWEKMVQDEARPDEIIRWNTTWVLAQTGQRLMTLGDIKLSRLCNDLHFRILQKRHELHPNDRAVLRNLSFAYSRQCDQAFIEGSKDEAQLMLTKALKIDEILAEKTADDFISQTDLCSSLSKAGDFYLMDDENYEMALAQFRKCQVILERLAEEYPLPIPVDTEKLDNCMDTDNPDSDDFDMGEVDWSLLDSLREDLANNDPDVEEPSLQDLICANPADADPNFVDMICLDSNDPDSVCLDQNYLLDSDDEDSDDENSDDEDSDDEDFDDEDSDDEDSDDEDSDDEDSDDEDSDDENSDDEDFDDEDFDDEDFDDEDSDDEDDFVTVTKQIGSEPPQKFVFKLPSESVSKKNLDQQNNHLSDILGERVMLERGLFVHHLLRCNYERQGTIAVNIEDYQLGFVFFLTQGVIDDHMALLKPDSIAIKVDRARTYLDLGDLQIRDRCFDLALFYLLECERLIIPCYQQCIADSDQIRVVASLYERLGTVQSLLDKNDDAAEYYQKCLQFTLELPQYMMESSITKNNINFINMLLCELELRKTSDPAFQLSTESQLELESRLKTAYDSQMAIVRQTPDLYFIDSLGAICYYYAQVLEMRTPGTEQVKRLYQEAHDALEIVFEQQGKLNWQYKLDTIYDKLKEMLP